MRHGRWLVTFHFDYLHFYYAVGFSSLGSPQLASPSGIRQFIVFMTDFYRLKAFIFAPFLSIWFSYILRFIAENRALSLTYFISYNLINEYAQSLLISTGVFPRSIEYFSLKHIGGEVSMVSMLRLAILFPRRLAISRGLVFRPYHRPLAAMIGFIGSLSANRANASARRTNSGRSILLALRTIVGRLHWYMPVKRWHGRGSDSSLARDEKMHAIWSGNSLPLRTRSQQVSRERGEVDIRQKMPHSL